MGSAAGRPRPPRGWLEEGGERRELSPYRDLRGAGWDESLRASQQLMERETGVRGLSRVGGGALRMVLLHTYLVV